MIKKIRINAIAVKFGLSRQKISKNLQIFLVTNKIHYLFMENKRQVRGIIHQSRRRR